MSQIKLNEIKEYIDSYLMIAEFEDDSWNGLQFEGKGEVGKIATAVDASVKSIKQAVQEKADMLLVHHGHYWKMANPSIRGWQKDRFDVLFDNSLSLYAAHLPLDRHREIGNNAQLLGMLGAEITGDFHVSNGQAIGWTGKLKEKKPLKDVVEVINDSLGADSHVLDCGNKEIETVAVCSGGGSMKGVFEALSAGVDLYVSGEPVYADVVAQDAKMNIVFAGHYHTETVGVKALGEHLAEKFGVEHVFLDMLIEGE